ncbi:MAG: hypothetical protein KBD24_00975 [Candidatus Pacebacteria bacterium]|nr:hypothetical protein [Candidatus Paceibacterota bacterium]
MQKIIIKFEHIHIERLLGILLWTSLALALAVYIYCIVLSVVNVVLRQELVVSVEHEQAHIGDLETTYLARSAELSSSMAEGMGFVALKPIAYVSVGTEHERLTRAE